MDKIKLLIDESAIGIDKFEDRKRTLWKIKKENESTKKMSIFQSMASKSHSLMLITFWNGRTLRMNFEVIEEIKRIFGKNNCNLKLNFAFFSS